MNRFVAYIFLLSISNMLVSAQPDSGFVANQQFKVSVQPNGALFALKDGSSASEFPVNSAKHMFQYSSSWMLGLVNDSIFANINLSIDQPQVWPGPIDTLTILPKDAIDWAKVWEVTRAEVEFHNLHFMDAGYTVPDHIKNWPSKHEESNVNAFLAPFIDRDGDGVYNPENGDYPSFLGDQAAYFIANDLYGENMFPKASKLSIEVQGLVYSFNSESLKNAVFVKLFLINRSVNQYAPFFYGQYMDFQLGNSNDNYVSTHVEKSMIYGYNGDSDDEGANGYGIDIPAAACVFLNQDLYSSTAFQPLDTSRDFPQSEKEMHSIMEGRWRTNGPKYASGNGVVLSQGKETRFIYPKKTDMTVSSENWGDQMSNDGPGKRNGLGVIQFPSFPAKSYKRIDLVYVATQSEQNVEESLLTQVDQARSYFKKNLGFKNLQLDANRAGINVYPNPIRLSGVNYLNLNALEAFLIDEKGAEIGHLVRSELDEKKFKIPCSEKLSSGIYYIKAVTETGIYHEKVILVAD